MSVNADTSWRRSLRGNDAFRWQPGRSFEPGYREWHHFCVLGEQLDVLLNFSVLGANRYRPAAAQVMALVRRERWKGGAERVSVDDLEIRIGRLTARFGESRIECDGDGDYHVHVALRDHGIEVDAVLRPVTEPFVVHDADPAGDARLSWLVVPHLRASGRVTVDGVARSFEDAPAYHDHNWGRWGTEGVWDWGFGLPLRGEPDGAVLFVRLSDRARTEVRVQGLFLWEGASLRRVVRDGDLRFSEAGSVVTRDACKVPAVLRLLAPGDITGTPAELSIAYVDGADSGVVRFASEQVAQVLTPEDTYPGLLKISEVSASFELSGTLGGKPIRSKGRGLFEHVTG